MFNKNLLNILCWILAVMLAVQVVLSLIVWAWSYFANVDIPVELNKIIGNLANLGQIAFFYVVVAVLRNLLTGKR